MSPEFLKSDTWVAVLDTLLMRLEQVDPIQCELDSLYEQMSSEIILEMDEYINYKDKAKHIHKWYEYHKPYWTNDLTLAWKAMPAAEREFRECR